MLAFAIETSCDETSVCVLNDEKKILSHIVYSQEEHKKFGGVVPEIASRSHLQILQKISKEALKESKVDVRDIDIFAATCGPGLIGGLLVGSTFGKSLAIGAKKPFVPVNHLEGHLLSPTFNNTMTYPYLSFLLTGGHTQIYLVHSLNKYEMLGETLDDAIGEAFDKVAKLLGMQYPGGPEIENKAKKGLINSYNLPRPLNNKETLNFSFSGIKTAINLIVKKTKNKDRKFKENISASFQEVISQILENKLSLTLKYLSKRKINVSQIALVGGVASNEYIRKKLEKKLNNLNYSIVLPPNYMLSDNAAMIGWAAIQNFSLNEYSDLFFKPDPRLQLK